MKKRHLIIGAMVCCAVMGTPGTAMSQMSETTTNEVYDFSGFVDVVHKNGNRIMKWYQIF
ncbi:hypothetical protein [Coprobacter fastidiosus]|uniref:hypothetical protein n=1 Tax=Coprobacter fastidiosus TaxID=1099853 RepID=UPI001DC5F3DE|nr:hypothetical protein [Coprobacter fastidiosus]HJF43059.1 hypothetical protein [Coprobacter fastidiosus]